MTILSTFISILQGIKRHDDPTITFDLKLRPLMTSQIAPKKERKGARGARKVKTGCMTCKFRHKRCDEQRPACLQCISTGRACDLLSVSITAQTLWRQPKISLPQPSSPVWGTTTLDPTDVWNFEYFRVVCIKDFAFIFQGSLEEKVLRAACAERCILDAVAAVGALSRNAIPSKASSTLSFASGHSTRYALQKYNLAMNRLREILSSSQENSDIAMLGSIIFIILEMLQGRIDVAQLHLRSAWAILDEHEKKRLRNRRSGEAMVHYLQAFSTLDVSFSHQTKTALPITLPTLPPGFDGINEARDALNSLHGFMNTFFKKWKNTPGSRHDPSLYTGLAQDFSSLLRHLESWERLFAGIEANREIDPKTSACTLILRMSYEVIYITASTFWSTDEIVYDAHMARFVAVVESAEKLLDTREDGGTNALRSATSPQLDVAVVQPLFFVICKCRNGATRRRTVQMLEKTGIGGFYESRLRVQAARWIIAMEEACSASNIPQTFVEESDRLHDVSLDVDAAAGVCKVSAWRRGGHQAWHEVSHLVHFN